MRAVQLNRKLVLEAPQKVADGAGGFTVSWTALGSLWASIEARTGSETLGGGVTPVSRMNYRIVVRAAPPGAASRPVPDQRFREGARVFVIKAVANRDPSARYLTCFAQEETAV